ncbi:MAG: cysteine peptidase family C39 domain-containing protein, partial [Limisphaerales bacterium]
MASLPESSAPTTQNQSGVTSGFASGNVAFGRPAVPAFIATNAPELNGIIGDREQMKQYVADNPNSPYTPWLENSLATIYRNAGRITPALSHWKDVWEKLKNSNDSESQNEANHALAGQAELLTMLGRTDELHDLLKAAEGRTFSNPADRERIEKAKEGYMMMLRYPELNFRCGTLALAEIARMQGKPQSTINALVQEPSPKEGISLLRLVQLSRQYGLDLVAVKRTDDTPLPTPCIVHWSQNHYGALLEYRPDLGSYREIFDDPKWIAASDVDAEASGYFLIPENQRPASWPIVSDSECSQILGRSYIYSIDDSKDKGCKIKPTDTIIRCPNCPDAKGMPAWWVTEPYINVWLADEPVSYTTSRGEGFPFRITIKQRDSLGTIFAYPRPGLLHNWYSRIYLQILPDNFIPQTSIVGGHTVTNTYEYNNWTATLDLGTGGQVTYNPNFPTNDSPYAGVDNSSAIDEETKTQLKPTYGPIFDGTPYKIVGYPIYWPTNTPWIYLQGPLGAIPIPNGPRNDAMSGFRVFYPDGSIDRYG